MAEKSRYAEGKHVCPACWNRVYVTPRDQWARHKANLMGQRVTCVNSGRPLRDSYTGS